MPWQPSRYEKGWEVKVWDPDDDVPPCRQPSAGLPKQTDRSTADRIICLAATSVVLGAAGGGLIWSGYSWIGAVCIGLCAAGLTLILVIGSATAR